MFGGKFNYGKEYAKYRPKQPASIFEQYVDETPDLLSAWNQIESDPQGTQGSYWIPRGASSKAAFGRAHAAEDSALAGGTYRGGTDVAPWTGGTRFEGFLDLLSGGGTTATPPGPLGEYTGSNPYYPVMDTQYSAPSGGGLIPDAYATWSDASKAYVPENIWSGAETAPLTGLGYGVEYNAPRFGPITIPAPETEGTSGTSGTSGTTTDASGNKWVITPGGQWISADSEYGQALAAKNAAYSQHYDSSGAYVGAEGVNRRSIMRAPPGTPGGVHNMVYVDSPINTRRLDGVIEYAPVPQSHFGEPWENTPLAPALEKLGINKAATVKN